MGITSASLNEQADAVADAVRRSPMIHIDGDLILDHDHDFGAAIVWDNHPRTDAGLVQVYIDTAGGEPVGTVTVYGFTNLDDGDDYIETNPVTIPVTIINHNPTNRPGGTP